MAQKEESSTGIFTISNLIWLLILLIAIFLAYQIFGNKAKAEDVVPTQNAVKQSKNDAYTDFLEKPLGLLTPMTKSNDSYFMEGMNSYVKNQYTNARETWESLPKQSTVGPDTLNFYLGATYFAQKDFDKASKYFQKALAKPGTDYTLSASWFLAVCHKEMRNSYLALEYLNKVEDHPMKDKLLHYLQGVIPDK